MDIIELARSRIGQSTFNLKAEPDWAPEIVNCSGFVRWLFVTARGIVLPRYAWQQHVMAVPIPREEVEAGDLIFMKGTMCRVGAIVGHVAIASTSENFIHATSSINGVGEFPIANIRPKRLVSFGRIRV